MGEPNRENLYYPEIGRRLCELKYLSSKGEEINLEIPLVVTSEEGKAQT